MKFEERKGIMTAEHSRWSKRLWQYMEITVAAVFYGAGVSLFLDPNNLAPGGVTGISVILNRLCGIETGTLYFLLNIPIVLLGIWKFGFRFLVSTVYAILATSFFTNLFAGYGTVTNEPLLAALAGSVLVAVGIGIIFRAGATTGGTDILIKILRLKYKHIRTGVLFFLTDFVIVCCSGFVFRNFNTAIYALIAVVVNGRVLDIVLYGPDEAKLIYIISSKPEQIAERLLEEVESGVTYLNGEGGYSNEQKKVIMCVTKKQQAPRLEEIVKQEDGSAFLIVTSANEIYGEGYKNLFSEKL